MANSKRHHSRPKRGNSRLHFKDFAPVLPEEEGRILERLLQDQASSNPLTREEAKAQTQRSKITLPHVNLPNPEDL